MSLRLRLSLLYSTILALTLIVFGVGVYLASAYLTYGTMEDTLKSAANGIVNSANFQLTNFRLPAQFANNQTLAQTCDLQGNVLHRTGNLALPLDPDQLTVIQQGQPFVIFQNVNDTRMLVYGTPVQGRNFSGVLLVARDVTEQDRTLGVLRKSLLAGGSIVTLLAFGIGWVLSGTALRPINRITGTARAIGSERDFSQRVDYAGPRDEVGRLATTFNTMLTELQAAYAQVEHALQTQRRFVADASHELRTPLTSIRGNLGLLQRQPPINAADRDAVLDDMVDETERMGRLVNDLLTLARTDAGRPLRNEPVPLKPLIDDVCRTAHALSTTHTIMCMNDVDVAVCGDADAIKQIALILLDNALRYTPAPGTVTLATGVSGQQVTINVRDTGPGIAPDLLPHIFERFRRGDAARSGGGTGLGLAIAKALVDAQHGTINVNSTPERGSVFTVTLPRATA